MENQEALQVMLKKKRTFKMYINGLVGFRFFLLLNKGGMEMPIAASHTARNSGVQP